ncbi:MAG: hypothetical protein ACYCZX_06615 [Rhodospirillaceae bacterium]
MLAPTFSGAPFPRASDSGQGFEANRDRILLTLLALDLMLMAFFVVMNSTATFDDKRGAEIASSMPAAPPSVNSTPEEKTPAPTDAAGVATPGMGINVRVAAAAELRAAVVDVFDSFLPAGTGAAADSDNGRVDVDLPAQYVRADELPPAVVAGLAHVMENPPAGYRTELVVRAQEEPGGFTHLAHLARDLVGRGVAANALSVGMLTGTSSPGLHFTFLLLEPGEESRAARVLAKGRP